MRSWSWPRGAYQSSRPRIRTSVPSVIRTPPPARVRARFTEPLFRADSITPIEALPSKAGSVSVKYTWPELARDRSRISPRTHTSSRNAARSALPMPVGQLGDRPGRFRVAEIGVVEQRHRRQR